MLLPDDIFAGNHPLVKAWHFLNVLESDPVVSGIGTPCYGFFYDQPVATGSILSEDACNRRHGSARP